MLLKTCLPERREDEGGFANATLSELIRPVTPAYYACSIKAPVVVAANAVLLVPAVPSMSEHPALPNENKLAVIQSNR